MSKRAYPGAMAPSAGELSEDVLALLDALEKEQERFVLADEFASMYKIIPFYEKRREKLKAIPNFWPLVFQNDTVFTAAWGQHKEDLEALKYLEDVWIARDKPDPRAFVLELHFKENPFFSNKVITKTWKLKAPPSGEIIDGIYESMLAFNGDTDLVRTPSKIDWKNDKVNLTKKYTRPSANVMDGDVELGSFFTFFEKEEDDLDFGFHVANEIFGNPIGFFKGEIDDSDEDEEMSSEEDDDSGAEEIDLERPSKRVKRA